MFHDGSGLDCSVFIDDKFYAECFCPASDLIFADEDSQVRRDS
jgi:hypothetical protein